MTTSYVGQFIDWLANLNENEDDFVMKVGDLLDKYDESLIGTPCLDGSGSEAEETDEVRVVLTMQTTSPEEGNDYGWDGASWYFFDSEYNPEVSRYTGYHFSSGEEYDTANFCITGYGCHHLSISAGDDPS